MNRRQWFRAGAWFRRRWAKMNYSERQEFGRTGRLPQDLFVRLYAADVAARIRHGGLQPMFVMLPKVSP